MWASGYDINDHFSKPYQQFFDGLTATLVGDGFIKAAAEGKTVVFEMPRVSPANVGGVCRSSRGENQSGHWLEEYLWLRNVSEVHQ